MPIFFIVRATISDSTKRAAFDDWYRKEHLPDAVKAFGAEKAWRFWSETDPAAHHDLPVRRPRRGRSRHGARGLNA